MKWMLRLYPPAWRRRYGREFRELIAAQPASVAVFVDVLAGAVDAWRNPQLSVEMQAAPAAKENAHMLAKMLNLRCAGHTPHITPSDLRKSAAVVLGATFVLTVILLWVYKQTRDNSYIDTMAFLPLAWFAPYLYALRYGALKAWPRATQNLFIGGAIALFTVFFLVIGFISART